MTPDDPTPPGQELLGRREFLGRGVVLAASVGVLGPRSILTRSADDVSLGNETIAASWSTSGGVLRAREVIDRASGSRLAVSEAIFAFFWADGSRLAARQMRIGRSPAMESLAANPRAARAAGRITGRRATV